MMGYELNRLMSELAVRFDMMYLGLGEFQKWTLPRCVDKTWMVVLLDRKQRHWTLLACYSGQCYFYDSLGIDIASYDINLSLSLQHMFGPEHVLHLPFPVQNSNSLACGYMVLYFAYKFSLCPSQFPNAWRDLSPTELTQNSVFVVHCIQSVFEYAQI